MIFNVLVSVRKPIVIFLPKIQFNTVADFSVFVSFITMFIHNFLFYFYTEYTAIQLQFYTIQNVLLFDFVM